MKFRKLLAGASVMALTAASASALTLPLAFDNTNGWKKDADGNLVMDENGNPIYVNTQGSEMSVGGQTIASLNAEAKQHREAKETAETKLKQYEGIDPEKARAALETVANISSEDKVTAEDIKRIKDEARAEAKKESDAAYGEQISTRDARITELTGTVDKMTLDFEFERSTFIAEQTIVPREMMRSTFGSNFSIEDGKPIARDNNGNQIYSDKNMGEPATFDEAIEKIVTNHPNRDQIMKAAGEQRGSGSNGRGGNRGNVTTITRSKYNQLPASEQAATARKAAAGEVSIVAG